MNNEERDQREALCQKEVEGNKGEVAKLMNRLEQVLSFKDGKGMSARPLVGNTINSTSHKKKLALLLITSPSATTTLNSSNNAFSHQRKTISFLV
jgi:hypothetical protein